RLIKFEDRRLRAAGAGVVLAAMNDVDAAVGRDFDGGHRGPRHTSGRLAPVAYGAIRVGQIVDGFLIGLGVGGRDHCQKHHSTQHNKASPWWIVLPSGNIIMGELVDRDQEHLRLLVWAHYIWAGTIGFFSLFTLIYIGLGVMMVSG